MLTLNEELPLFGLDKDFKLSVIGPELTSAERAVRRAVRPPPPRPPDDTEMPFALKDQIKSLEEWAQANLKDARRDTVRFWMLKIPAILVSAGSGIFAYFKLDGVAVVAGAIAGICVLIDGLNPGGALRNVHLRAFNDLRQLADSIASGWQVGAFRRKDHNLLAARIIETAGKEKDRISAYLTAAETSLAISVHGKHHH